MDDKTRCSQSYEKNNTEWSYCNTDAMVFTCVENTIQQWRYINCADVEQRRGSEWISWFLSWFLVIMTRGCRTAATALLWRDLVRLNSHLLSCFVSALWWGPAQRCDDEQSFVCQPCESSPPLQLSSSLRQQEKMGQRIAFVSGNLLQEWDSCCASVGCLANSWNTLQRSMLAIIMLQITTT